MTAPIPSFLHSLQLHSSHQQRGTRKTQMSHTKILEEPHNFRAFFVHRWSQFLRENYRNPEEVSVVFGVRFQTGLNWWNGVNRPSGDVVAMAALRHGEKFTDSLQDDK